MVLAVLLCESVGDFFCPCVAPDDGIVVWLACFGVPGNGGLTLIGDATTFDLVETIALGLHLLTNIDDELGDVVHDLHGVVFEPALMLCDLLMFFSFEVECI